MVGEQEAAAAVAPPSSSEQQGDRLPSWAETEEAGGTPETGETPVQHAEETRGGDKQLHVLLGVTGSVAAIKLEEICRELFAQAEQQDLDLAVKIVATEGGLHFVPAGARATLPRIFTDEDETSGISGWKKLGDPILHIQLRQWADVFAVAPLSANSLAKLAAGLCNNLLTCVARAWNFQKPFLVFPAMNTLMWEHPFTARHLAELERLGALVVPPVAKTLACGDTGMGGLPPPADVAANIIKAARAARSL